MRAAAALSKSRGGMARLADADHERLVAVKDKCERALITERGESALKAVATTLVLQIMLAVGASAQEGRPARPPIIDMHLHANELWAPPGEDAGVTFGPVFGERRLGLPAAESNEQLQEATLAALDRYNIVFAVVTGDRSVQYRAVDPSRFLAGSDPHPGVPVDSLRAAFAAGRYQVLAEFMSQFAGMAPDDER